MKISIKKYLLYSSVFAIFTESLFFHFIIDIKLLYLIIIVNYLLLVKIRKITINKYLLIIICGLLIHGLTVNIIIGIPLNYLIAQILGITIIGTYYFNFISLYDLKTISNIYTKFCLYAALIGYPMYFFNINLNDGLRFQSVFLEPAHYAIVVIPSCYYFFKEKKYWSFAAIFGTLILTNSSLGYIGCALMIILPNFSIKKLTYLIFLIPIVFVIFLYIYNEFSFFKLRIDDTYNSVNVINTGKFDEKTNLSSYAMISNIFVAKKNIADHPFGSGVGSHHYMHTNVYLKSMRPPEYIKIQKRHTINSFDANSLFTRIISELGLIGLILTLWGLIIASKVYFFKDFYLPQGIFIYFLLKLFRDGHYFPPEFFFFIWMFYFYFKNERSKIKSISDI